MIAVAPTEQRPAAPSVQKYGAILLEDGFTQYPHAINDFLAAIHLCPREVLLLIAIGSCQRKDGQEVFPSVGLLAEKCGVGTRRIHQMTAHLVEMGLITKRERFAGRSQLSNYYDLEPLHRKVTAWKDAGVAAALAEQEAQADEPFEPANVLEEAAQIISEEFGEPEPRQIRYNNQRLYRRFDQHQGEWETFADSIEKAAQQTEERKAEPTRTGRAFTKLVPYFFSALDYWLSRQPTTVLQPPAKTTQSQASQNKEQPPSEPQAQPAGSRKGPMQPPKKSGPLAERAQARKAAEAAGKRKVRAPETLACHIRAAALTFNDDQEKSSVQRAANLMADARLNEQTMLDFVAEARAEASQRSNIKARNKHGQINRMPYFFQILEEKVQEHLQ